MQRKEIVRKAIEFDNPPRLPFWQNIDPNLPDDVFATREMDRGRNGWFFDNPVVDDWGCGWEVTETKNMGQVVEHPLQDWSKLKTYQSPGPRDSFYYERLHPELEKAEDRYVVVTCHFNLFERLYMLHGFNETLMDFYEYPDKIKQVIDMILNFKMEQVDELHSQFGDKVNAVFMTDDWGTQEATFISKTMFDDFFLEKYEQLVTKIHACNMHMFLHSCGKINDFLPGFIEAGIDVMNIMQPQCYGIAEVGQIAAGKIAFLASADIQKTLPSGDPDKIREEVKQLLSCWNTDKGGLIAFNSGEADVLGVKPNMMSDVMMQAFAEFSL